MRSDQDRNPRPKIPPACRGETDRKVTVAVAMGAAFGMGGVVALVVEQMAADRRWDQMTYCMAGVVLVILIWLGQGIGLVQDLVKRR